MKTAVTAKGSGLGARLVREGAEALVTARLSGESRDRLAAAGMILFTAESGSVLDLVEAVREGL
jgi:predicted Fe-Mo cluster-binding NifX family protein